MAEVATIDEQHLHQSQSFWTRYVWSQNHNAIALQYSLTAIAAGILALVFSALVRMPLTVWGIFMASIMALLAFAALLVGAIMMLFDRLLGTNFFMPALLSMEQQTGHGGGSPLLRRRLALVYAILVPLLCLLVFMAIMAIMAIEGGYTLATRHLFFSP
jgi:heme/copper-type cytochrome/quinol oxidase subunit 1